MKNVPGISWSIDGHVNLIRSSIGWLAIYYDDPDSKPEIIRVFNPKDYVDYYKMMKQLAYYNYNTCALCPLVRAELEWQN